MPDLVLSIKEAAQMSGLSEATIRRLAYYNKIPCKRIDTGLGKRGWRVLILRKAFEDWLLTPDMPTPRKVRGVFEPRITKAR